MKIINHNIPLSNNNQILENTDYLDIEVAITGSFPDHPQGSYEITLPDLYSIINNFNMNKRPILVDFDHNSLNPVICNSESAGWIEDLRVVDDMKLIGRTKLTSLGLNAFNGLTYRWVSPVYEMENPGTDTQIVTLHSVAFTNIPFLKELTSFLNCETIPNKVIKEEVKEEVISTETTIVENSESLPTEVITNEEVIEEVVTIDTPTEDTLLLVTGEVVDLNTGDVSVEVTIEPVVEEEVITTAVIENNDLPNEENELLKSKILELTTLVEDLNNKLNTYKNSDSKIKSSRILSNNTNSIIADNDSNNDIELFKSLLVNPAKMVEYKNSNSVHFSTMYNDYCSNPKKYK